MRFKIIYLLSLVIKVMCKLSLPACIINKIVFFKGLIIDRELKEKYSDILKDVECEVYDFNNIKYTEKTYVWYCWLQGENNLPSIIKSCYQSVLDNFKNYDVVFISEHNFQDYVNISSHILDKYHSGIISKAHFSDILRFHLLFEHGGVWVDSTLYFGRELSIINDCEFFTLRSNIYPKGSFTLGKWSCSFMKLNKKNRLSKVMIDFYDFYWQKNNIIIDYFILDYCLLFLYKQKKSFYNSLKAIPITGDMRFFLIAVLNKKVNGKINEALSRDCYQIYKLTYKIPSKFYENKNNYLQLILKGEIPS